MRIGIFGGTFNPIHLGHLRAAEEIRERFDLDRVIFIAAAVPPHKEVEGGIPGEHRMEMVRLAISGNPHFSISDIELKRPGKSYSISTIQFFRQRFGSDSEMFFILGMDAFLEIGTWKSFQELFSLCHFIVMTRPGFEKPLSAVNLPAEIEDAFVYDEEGDRFTHRNGYSIYLQGVTFLDISSTKIREEISKGRSIRYLLPPEVERYIRRHHFYRGEGRLE
ncbi:MAG: nicotinate-nucleotide adenylyltransferase [Proteobacteria bacterium]|nr:nicotinate-nucleotide adenylyltransferase [Pseudomonadota bacterium]